MILTGHKIQQEVRDGNIVIDDFDINRINPNSYNLRLGNQIGRYTDLILDCKEDNNLTRSYIPKDGVLLEPGELYLANTVERTITDCYVPMLEGRSSLARLGLSVHITAGFGDIGFNGVWTLEMTCVRPTKIYAGMEICQVYFVKPEGLIMSTYSGKYQGATSLQKSRVHYEFPKDR